MRTWIPAAVFIGALCNGLEGYAQQSDSTVDEGASDQLVEVTVTAQRHEEDMQKVPIAVTALSGAALQAQGVSDARSLVAAVPGLDFSQSNNASAPFIRGVGSDSGTPGQQNSVAMYVDGVYIASPSGSLFAFNNVERVEVLRGPQGTLFGRNATGGVIQIITRDPSPVPSAEVNLGYGSHATREASLYATTGLTDTLAMDLAFTGEDQREGWGRNLTTGEENFKGREYGVRSKLSWTASDRTKVRVALDYNDLTNQMGLASNFFPGSLGLDGRTGFGGYYNTSDNPEDFNHAWVHGMSLTVNHNFDAAELLSISSYRLVKAHYQFDQDATPSRITDIFIRQADETSTQEFQLRSPDNDASRLKWIVGAFFLKDRAYHDVNTQGASTGAFAYRRTRGQQGTESYAGFGEVTARLFTDTNLTAGLRYTRDKRDIEGGQQTGPSLTTPVSAVAIPARDVTFQKPSWRLVLDRQFTTDLLGYASYNRGFKSGLYNTADPRAAPVRPEVLDAYEIGMKSEWAHNRLRLNAAAYYYDYQDIQVNFIPGNTGNTTGQSSILLNAAAARYKGIDLDVEALVMRNLTVRGGANFTDGQYTSFFGAPSFIPRPTGGATATSIDASGNDTAHTPKLTVNVAGSYRIPSASGDYNFELGASYSDGFFWQPDNVLQQPSYTQLTAALGWQSNQNGWGVRFWGRNLLDEQLFSYARIGGTGAQFSMLPPRTYGVTLSKDFE